MAKKARSKSIPKIKRTSSMEKTIAEGKQYLQYTKKKRIVKTRTMMQTIEEAKGIKKIKVHKKTTFMKAKAPIRHSKKSNPAKSMKKTVAKTSKAISIARKIYPDILPVRADSKIVTGSIGKATKFIKKSDNLPIPTYGFIDVCFCIDATGSMHSQLAQAQSMIGAIMDKIQNKVAAEGITLRFGVVTYRDHPPQDSSYVTKILDFTDHYQAINYVKKLTADGGGDFPQAVHDGLLDSCQKLNWVNLPGTPVLRYIFHIADAPPHGQQFDNSDSKKGCLCGKQTQEIIQAINKKQIHYRLIKARNNSQVDKMENIFKKGIVDFDSTDIGHASQMDVRVSDMIIHEILPDYA